MSCVKVAIILAVNVLLVVIIINAIVALILTIVFSYLRFVLAR
jgi:hypothetical protein